MDSGLTRYQISRDTGVGEATLSKFQLRQRGLSMEALDKLGEFFELEIVARGTKTRVRVKRQEKAMGLIDVLTEFGFDLNCPSRMARHQDNRTDFDTLLTSGRFEEYQCWQRRPVFHGLNRIVSFVGHGPGRALFWGVYRVGGNELVAFDDLPTDVPWIWQVQQPYYRYDLVREPGYEQLVEGEFVIEWSSERTWVQHLKNYRVVACPALRH